ncbi:protein commissureless 1-like [Musca autumnalis]|uniref:protein commissureless 1-like n=1 Tax=Musca autumnalis TaxID=221902 RepID=UPI003CF5727E
MSSTMDYLEDTTTTILPPITTTTPTMEPMTASPTIMDMWMSQLQKDHPEISFVVPSEHDNHHIDNMMNFKRLLEKVGNTAYDTISAEHQYHSGIVDSLGQPITHEQISNSAVLNMADLKTLSGWERFFAGADMNSLINYLWVGVVTSLVILTVIFVVFSCYFYRKFRQWKKCNKDIRAHLNNDMYPGTIVPCDAAVNPEAAYYQMPPPPPPCYTIATGLPTYDEALHHQQQHFAFGMKFIYPTLAAVHHQASNLMSSWEKYDMQSNKQKQAEKKTTASSPSKVAKCKSSSSSSSAAVATQTNVSKSSATDLLLPPCYDVTASMALLAPEEPCDNVCINIPVEHSSTEASSDLTDIITV